MDKIIEKKKWTPKKILSLSAGGIFVLFVLYLLFFRDKSSRLYVPQEQLTLTEVKLDKFQEFIPIDGVVFPKTTIYIDAVQGGIVEKVYVEDGALLKKGDTIIKLNNADMELRFMEQETRIYDAINNLQNSLISLERNGFQRQREIIEVSYQIDQTRKDFERKEELYKDRLISDKEYEDADREFNYSIKQLEISLKLKRLDSISAVKQTRQINNSIDRMDNNLALLRQNLENLYIKAPAEGKLSSFFAEIGETKRAGEHLGQIDMDDGFKLRANIDERYTSRVFIGQEAEYDFGGKIYHLEISKIYTDVTNGSFQVDLIFVNNEEPTHIKRGQTLQLRLKFSSATDALIIRKGGFFQETGGNWIYVVDPSGEFAVKRNIRLGRQNTRHYEVMEGLNEGETVIVSSYDTFGAKDKLIFK